jgi:hypothetical protein
MLDVNLIHLFNFYLAATFLLSCYRRFGLYRAVGGMVLDVPARWPKLFELIRGQHTVFLTWTTAFPAVLALTVLLAHTTATHFVWPQADLTLSGLAGRWFFLPLVLLAAAAMLGMDIYTLLTVGSVDRTEVEKQLDRAEYWLTAWPGKVVSLLTFGKLDPRQMVAVEVKKALTGAAELLNRSLWWVSLQTALRVFFGLSLWVTWALTGGQPKHTPEPSPPPEAAVVRPADFCYNCGAEFTRTGGPTPSWPNHPTRPSRTT